MCKETFTIWKPSPNSAAPRSSQIAIKKNLPEDDLQISFKKNDWVFHTGPWSWPIVSWYTNPNVWTLRFLESSTIWEHLPLLLGKKLMLRLLLVHPNLIMWRWCQWFWQLSFEMLKILVQWFLRNTQNRPSQHHLGAQPDLRTFAALPPI